MKALLLFQFRYRKKAWIYHTLISSLMLTLLIIQTNNFMWFFLALIPNNCSAIQRPSVAITQNIFIPYTALPFGKKAFIAYIQVLTGIFYILVGLLTAITASSLHAFFPRIPNTWNSASFIILLLATYQSVILITDCLTSMRGGILVILPVVLFTYSASSPFSGYIANAANEGLFIPLKIMNSMTYSLYQWTISFQLHALFLAFTIAMASGIFALAWAKRIRF